MENGTGTKPPWQKTSWQHGRFTSMWPAAHRYESWVGAVPTPLLSKKQDILPLEQCRQWELVKKMANPYELVFTHDDDAFHPSLALSKPLSRSYYKLVEMFHVLQFFERIQKQQQKIRTAHVAEGPGGFIQAVTDLAERNKKLITQATAMTLRPTDYRVPGWRRAASFLHKHREVRLHYGADNTGDVYILQNQDSFIEAIHPGADLFTADGGFDFSIDYDLQEQSVYRLLVCSATVGLRSLFTGGSIVLKLFDTYSESTQILMSIVGRCFKEWTLYKPAMSRPCNSERYFLGRGFKGLPKQIYDLLLSIQAKVKEGLYITGREAYLSPEEIQYFDQLNTNLTESQIVALNGAMRYAANPEEWYSTQLPKTLKTSMAWCQVFRIPCHIYTAPLPIKSPRKTITFCDISGGVAAPQSRLPGAGSDCPDPSDPTAPA
jgi:23S rRNA U2552 (ribose-2'-O)-methylase RlmE/FtsJ